MLFETRAEANARHLREIIEFFIGPIDEPLPLTARLKRFGCVCVSLFAAFWLTIWMGKLGLGPSASMVPGVASPLGALSWAFWFLLWAGWWTLLFIIAFWPVFFLLSSFENLGARLVAYLVILVLAPLPARFTDPRVAPSQVARDAPKLEDLRQPSLDAAPPTSVPVEQAETDAASKLIPRIEELEAQRHERWRTDVTAAGAFGPPGTIPPMLEVHEVAGFLEVTNLIGKPVCVQVARLLRKPGVPGGIERCAVGPPSCREIRTLETERFQEFRNSAPECASAPLEFRVGTVLKPEPSWWTETALAEFDANPWSPVGQGYTLNREALAARVAGLEAELADTGRADRWRKQLQR